MNRYATMMNNLKNDIGITILSSHIDWNAAGQCDRKINHVVPFSPTFNSSHKSVSPYAYYMYTYTTLLWNVRRWKPTIQTFTISFSLAEKKKRGADPDRSQVGMMPVGLRKGRRVHLETIRRALMWNSILVSAIFPSLRFLFIRRDCGHDFGRF